MRRTSASDNPPLRPLKVLTLTNFVEGGGAERWSVALAQALDRTRFEPWVCASRADPSETTRALTAAGIPMLLLGRGRGRSLQPAKWLPLLRLLRRERVDILHAHKFHSNMWAVVIGRLARVPVVIATEHTWSYRGQPMRRLLDRWLIGTLASAFVAVSRRDAQSMAEIEHVARRKIRVIHNGLAPRPESLGAPDGAGVRGELGIPAHAPVISTVCVLRPQKALDVLVDAFAIVTTRHPEARLLIAGHGPEREGLEARARERGVAERVLFLGRRDDVDDILAATDVFALSSRYEGLPLAVLEAMAAGCPVVATAVGGLPEIAEGGSMVLVPPADPPALASALQRLVEAPGERAVLGNRARARIEESFTFEGSIRRWEGLYLELYDKAGRRTATR